MSLSKFQRDGKYLMLAFDHRGSFVKMMNPDNPDAVTPESAIALKKEIIDAVIDQATGILIDEDYGLPAYPNPTKPFLLPMEKTGYKDVNGERLAQLQFDAGSLKQKGASGLKLLLYFNPDYLSANGQIKIAREVLTDAISADLPSFVEIVTYKKEGELTDAEKPDLIVRSLKMFVDAGINPSVWKLQYPGSPEACAQVTKMLEPLDIPWIMLTGGEDFNDFKAKLQIAKDSGCVGFLAGRALWQEACPMTDQTQRDYFMKNTLPNRYKEVCDLMLT